MSNQAGASSGTITGVGSGRYTVRTDGGAVVKVSSGDRWPLGSRVIVVGGVIIGVAGAPSRDAIVYKV